MQTTPINIVTATHLDPRKYKKYLLAWGYLSALGLAQYVQYLLIKRKSKNVWQQQLQHWQQMLQNRHVQEEFAFQWAPFKIDYLQQSAQSLLMDFAHGKQLLFPLVPLGATYINNLNIIFDATLSKHEALALHKRLHENRSNGQHQFVQDMLQMLQGNQKGNNLILCNAP